MGSKWRKVKMALNLNTCLYVSPTTDHDHESSSNAAAGRFSDVVSMTPSTPPWASDSRHEMSATPRRSSTGVLRLHKHSSKSSKKTCAICLAALKPGRGQAIFTAECSHSFHFQCITSNVKHGNRICPICRAKWKEIPFHSPATDLSLPRIDSGTTAAIRQVPPRPIETTRNNSSPFHAPEPSVFNDDELVNLQPCGSENSSCTGAIEVKTYPEVTAVAKTDYYSNFTVLIHLKAPKATRMDRVGLPLTYQDSRASIDLITVLDVSGSMAGSKLALLKRAMGFVIENLAPSDRLSVISFSSTARRLFPLRMMTDTGKQEALQAVNSLSSCGGTNIAEGLRKGAKVMVDRKWRNQVSSMILLSDGQDTYSDGSSTRADRTDYHSLLLGLHLPVHTFGFGSDHDAVLMHSISEASGGTFSFIETQSAIQDGFAQCMGGLLSVVVEDLRVEVECVHPTLLINSIKAGSYKTSLTSNARMAFIEVRDLYAEEERDFLVTLDIPMINSIMEMSLLKVNCVYKDPISKRFITLNLAGDVKIQRPKVTGKQVVSREVNRERNRIRSAEAMAEARAAAERGDLAAAVFVLENCRKQLQENVSNQGGDSLCVALDAEMKEMQERMVSRQMYETSGRAYVLSGLSSHLWQRATARGDSIVYQTPSMVDMVSKSQTMHFGGPPHRSSRSVRAPSRPR